MWIITDFCGSSKKRQLLRIGTRGSKLALWQAHDLQAKLMGIGEESELVIIKTKGDIIQNLSFDKIEGKAFFTKEIEDALLTNEVDVAVHSLKDLPTNMDERLAIAGLSKRADPRDVLIIHPEAIDNSRTLKIKKDATIGTSSIRRQVQIRHFDKVVGLESIRGNVPTRISKVGNEVDAIVLAAAGVERLEIDLSNYKVIYFNPIEFVPAPAQGVIGYQCRVGDKTSRKIINKVHDTATADCSNVERKVLNLLDGGCQLPLGCYVSQDDIGNFHAYAALGSDVDSPVKHYSCSWSTTAGMAEHIYENISQ